VADKKEPVYKRKWFIPVVMLLVGMFIGVATGSGDSGVPSSGDDVAALESKVATLEADLERVTAERDALESAASQDEPEPTAQAEPSAPSPEVQRTAFASVFEENRVKLAQILESDDNVESVDKLAYDPASEVVTLDVTSTWASPDNQVEGAWAIVRLMSTLYDPDKGAWYQDGFVPSFVLVNSGSEYTQSADFMLRLATFSASRDDWESECW
jgi:hypothetical protein